MARYDWGRARDYDRGYGARRPRGYGSDFGSWGNEWGSSPSAGFWGRGAGLYRRWGTPAEAFGRGGRYDRELYGGTYPTYGGYPGGRDRGMYYGGRPGRDYDAGFAREPFMPEEAYQRHPEYNRPQRHLPDRWPDGYAEAAPYGPELDDTEIRQAVRQNLYNDNWLDADGVRVEVREGVVTLSGEVADYLEARYAWDDAWESPGVRGVVNNLTVRTDQPKEAHGEVMPQTSGGRKGAKRGG